MSEQETHNKVINDLRQQLGPIFEGSEQGIYLYLDEVHKVCNSKFAEMLGYDSPDEWASVTHFTHFVAEASQEKVVSTYQRTMEDLSASSINVTWRKKDGETFDTTVIMLPISLDGHLMALHFIS